MSSGYLIQKSRVRMRRDGFPELDGFVFKAVREDRENEVGMVLDEDQGHGDGGDVDELIERRSEVCVIVTHPHSKMGGDLNNNVVQSVMGHLAKLGYTVLIFNFRGVGGSGGSSTWSGAAERSDMGTAIEFARSMDRIRKVFLVGYSFGSAVGCSANELLDGYVAISYPYGWMAQCALGSLYSKADGSLPKLFLIGTKDQFASASQVEKFVSKMQDPTDFHAFEDVDHFWFGCENLLFDPITTFLESKI